MTNSEMRFEGVTLEEAERKVRFWNSNFDKLKITASYYHRREDGRTEAVVKFEYESQFPLPVGFSIEGEKK